MPGLSSFIGLGTMLFVATFIICYLYYAPAKALGRVFGLAMFVTIASISNQQSYSFLVVANTAMMFPIVFGIILLTEYVPFSPRPERALQRLLARFFRSYEFLLSTLSWERRRTRRWYNRWRIGFHVREVSTLPGKLGAWGHGINGSAQPGTTPEQVQALVASVYSLSNRLPGLIEERGSMLTSLHIQGVLEDIRNWHQLAKTSCQRLSVDPACAEHEVFRAGLSRVLVHLEARMTEVADKAGEDGLGSEDSESLYRLLGALRSVSEALVNYTGKAEAIDWAGWREERFA
jgi:hypothetical protein